MGERNEILVVRSIATDESFAAEFLAGPREALSRRGLQVCEESIAALRQVASQLLGREKGDDAESGPDGEARRWSCCDFWSLDLAVARA